MNIEIIKEERDSCTGCCKFGIPINLIIIENKSHQGATLKLCSDCMRKLIKEMNKTLEEK